MKALKLFFSLILIAVFLLATVTMWNYEKTNCEETSTLYLAHRGLSPKIEGQSLRSFAEAISDGADGLEFDVRQSKDNQLLVFHDRSFFDVEGNKHNIDELNYDQIKILSEGNSLFILRLEQVMELAKHNDNIPVWIEIKQSELYPEVVENLINYLSTEQYLPKAVIQSFNTADLTKIHSLTKDVELLKLAYFGTKNSLSELPDYVDYVGLPVGAGLLNWSIVEAAHSLDLKVIFWRESELLEKDSILTYLSRKGANGLMIDRPFRACYPST